MKGTDYTDGKGGERGASLFLKRKKKEEMSVGCFWEGKKYSRVSTPWEARE